MRTYTEARALIGRAVEASTAGGRTRWIRFHRWDQDTDAVSATLFETDVVTFHRDHVEIRTGGWVTPSTFDAIATALSLPRCVVGTTKRVPYILGHRMAEGMQLDYAGRLVDKGSESTPLAPPRHPKG